MSQKFFRDSLFVSVLILGLAMVSVFFAQVYVKRTPGTSVGDLLLDSLPDFPYEKTLLFFLVWGSVGFAFLSLVAIVISKPLYLPAAVATVGLMYLVRSVFLCITRLETHPKKILVPDEYGVLFKKVSKFVYGGKDLFFSGHVALPSTLSFVFWEMEIFRAFFLFAVVFFAVATLLAKAHYTIDVVTAPFIAYGVYRFTKLVLFPGYFCLV